MPEHLNLNSLKARLYSMDKIQAYIDRHKWIEWLLFAVLFWSFIVYLHLNRGLDDMIPGYHYWRKTDTYAQILNYYYNGLNFFDHSIYYNQMESNAKAVAEFPLFYYLIAIQLKIFGNHLIVLKINWLVMMFLGHFALFKIGHIITKNYFVGAVTSLVLFLSPTYVIYCIEFLPDPIALHCGFIGFYFLTRYYYLKHQRSRIWAIVFIGLSGLIKPFFLIPYLSFLLVYIIYTIVKKNKLKAVLIWVLPLAVIAIWFLYMRWYNNKMDNHSFLSKIMPIWSANEEITNGIWNKILSRWLDTYFHPIYAKIILGLAVVSMIIGLFKTRYAALLVLISYIGGAFFIVLFFSMFAHHDYYFFPLLFLAPLTILAFFHTIKQFQWPGYILTGLSIIVFVAIYNGSHDSWFARQQRLNNPRINATSDFKNYRGLDDFLTRKGVGKDDLVIAFSDKSPTYALLLMNRKGWSGYQTFYKPYTIGKLNKMGAQYVIINEALPPKRDSLAFRDVDLRYVADTNQIFIYKIEHD